VVNVVNPVISQAEAKPMNLTEDYGWTSQQGPSSCSYLVPEVLNILRELKPQRVLDLGAGNGALCRELFAVDVDKY
jgi:predicted RNA methylase